MQCFYYTRKIPYSVFKCVKVTINPGNFAFSLWVSLLVLSFDKYIVFIFPFICLPFWCCSKILFFSSGSNGWYFIGWHISTCLSWHLVKRNQCWQAGILVRAEIFWVKNMFFLPKIRKTVIILQKSRYQSNIHNFEWLTLKHVLNKICDAIVKEKKYL